jgi:dolichol-phosphate mannosyltransferase
MKTDLAIMVPTYNERENAPRLIEEIDALGLDADLVFVDDNSPDGTGRILEELKGRFPRLTVLHRPAKQGVGGAHAFGIRWAYAQGYKRLLTLDCDFTHPPARLPELLRASEGFDVVTGSRYLRKDSLAEWNLYRKILTHAGHWMTLLLLKMPYDATGALRFYRLENIPVHTWDLVSSVGYSFFFESLYVLHVNGFKINQIPVALPARTYGHSKMDFREIFSSVRLLCSIYALMLANRERFKLVEPMRPEQIDTGLTESQGWDGYRSRKTTAGPAVYDLIAAFYRKFIIRRSLNHFIRKHFARQANVLHAGCGSGQVDADIRDYVNITGLDISLEALAFYRQTNRDRCRILHGSIFAIPLPADSVDGIYNLGVMEHFTEEEIQRILQEFHRVLKPSAKAVLFWPPEFGLSVLFFKTLVFGARILGKKDVKFHPDEITRVRSRSHVEKLVRASNFSIVDYYFGARDLFTYSVVAIQKP